jgi:hypothetical protein
MGLSIANAKPESEVVKRFQIALLTSVSPSVCFYDGFYG